MRGFQDFDEMLIFKRHFLKAVLTLKEIFTINSPSQIVMLPYGLHVDTRSQGNIIDLGLFKVALEKPAKDQ